MTLAVKVALNPNTTKYIHQNQLFQIRRSVSTFSALIFQCTLTPALFTYGGYCYFNYMSKQLQVVHCFMPFSLRFQSYHSSQFTYKYVLPEFIFTNSSHNNLRKPPATSYHANIIETMFTKEKGRSLATMGIINPQKGNCHVGQSNRHRHVFKPE